MVSPAQDPNSEPTLADVLNRFDEFSDKVNERIDELSDKVNGRIDELLDKVNGLSQEFNQRDILQKEMIEQTNKWQDRSFLLLRWGIGLTVGLSLSAAGTVLGFALKAYFPG